MPVYDAEKYLEKTLESILAQTYTDWRLVLVNDGSADKSLRIAEKISNKSDGRVFIQSGPNQGVSAARNHALELFVGPMNPFHLGVDDLVAFCDADDVWWPQHLERTVDVFRRCPGLDFIYSAIDLKFSDGTVAVPCGIKQDPFYPPIYISTVVLRVRCLSAVGRFDGRINGREDWDYWCRIKDMGFRMFYLPEILTTYTVRTNGVAGSWTGEKEEIFRKKRGKDGYVS
jgi:teichuronic acid biosynthesis glycosyltransferase TuaG